MATLSSNRSPKNTPRRGHGTSVNRVIANPVDRIFRMDRSKSRLRNALVTLSAILCILLAAWWVRSYWVSDWLTWSELRPWHEDLRENHVVSLITIPGSF